MRTHPLRLEGPRERLFNLGSSALLDAEILALLLGCGLPGQPVLDLSETLLFQFGGLKSLCQQSAPELARLGGIGHARASRILGGAELGRRLMNCPDTRPRLISSDEIYRYLAPTLAPLRTEVFHVLSFNPRNVLLRDARVAHGSRDHCSVDPRDVFNSALSSGASAIVLAHNHPSGQTEPSRLDIALTKQLCEGGRILGVRVLDHLIVGDGYASLRQRGELPTEPI